MPQSMPNDFDADLLNPDVRNAGADATRHWQEHGALEGRQYRPAVISEDDRQQPQTSPATSFFNFTVLVALAFAVLHGPIFTSLPLTIDAEMNLAHHTPEAWVSQGRWAIYLLTKYVFTSPITPFFPFAIYAVCASAAYTLVVKAAGIEMDLKVALLSVIFTAYPLWSFILEFPANVPSVGVGLLFCALAVYAMLSSLKAAPRIVVQVALLAFAVACYQVFVLVYLAMAISVLLNKPEEVSPWSRIAEMVAVALAGVALYFLVNRAFLSALNISEGYLGNFVNIDALLTNPLGVMVATVREAAGVIGGSERVFGSPVWGGGALVLLGAAAVVQRASAPRLILLSGLLTVPFAMSFLAGGTMPHRALLAVPVAIWGLALAGTFAPQRWLRNMTLIAAGVCAFQTATIVSQHQAQRLLVADFDKQTAALLTDRISQVADLSQPVTIDFFGQLQAPRFYPTGQTSTAAASFFSWDNGNPDRMLSYLKTRGVGSLVLPTPPERRHLQAAYAAMPVWPDPKSVRVENGVVMVKLSGTAGYYPP